jgi:DNA invertase Pin-like site-specific DNA recombinase
MHIPFSEEETSVGELIGYARTSTKDQRLDLQLDALRAAGVEDRHLYQDQASGIRKDRPGFLACWAYLQPGDTLVVWRLDRLARSLRHLIELAEELRERGIELKVLEGPFAHLDTATSEGRLLFNMLGAFAQFERELIRDRVVAGLTAARARGRKGGRRPKLSPEQQRHAVMMAASQIPITEIAKMLQCSRHTVYAALRQVQVGIA